MKTADSNSVTPLHDVTNPDRLAALVDSMRSDGWTGRPLLVEVCGDGYQAWTGSHRVAAAVLAELDEIPIVVIDYDAIVDNEGEPADGQSLASLASDDESKVDMLRRAGLDDAAELMQMEVDNNADA